MNKSEQKYWIWFSRIKGVNCVQKNYLLNCFKSPREIWNLNKTTLVQIKGINNNCINEILNKNYRENIDKYEQYMEKNNIKIITILDKDYPEKLKNIYDKPIVIFAKGNINLLKSSGIAIVGCRNFSSYGKNTAEQLAYNLAKENKCIISGFAKGIDEYAHIGALKAFGKTIAVLGNGLDIVYPSENRKLFEQILENNGLIITEYVIGTKPEKLNFPARNRIISGISDAIVVVEAKKRSGALITADFGLEQGKEIFAVPGNINSINSEGTNELIKQGANILTNYKDVL